jgi:hypothetical protein
MLPALYGLKFDLEYFVPLEEAGSYSGHKFPKKQIFDNSTHYLFKTNGQYWIPCVTRDCQEKLSRNDYLDLLGSQFSKTLKGTVPLVVMCTKCFGN